MQQLFDLWHHFKIKPLNSRQHFNLDEFENAVNKMDREYNVLQYSGC